MKLHAPKDVVEVSLPSGNTYQGPEDEVTDPQDIADLKALGWKMTSSRSKHKTTDMVEGTDGSD